MSLILVLLEWLSWRQPGENLLYSTTLGACELSSSLLWTEGVALRYTPAPDCYFWWPLTSLPAA